MSRFGQALATTGRSFGGTTSGSFGNGGGTTSTSFGNAGTTGFGGGGGFSGGGLLSRWGQRNQQIGNGAIQPAPAAAPAPSPSVPPSVAQFATASDPKGQQLGGGFNTPQPSAGATAPSLRQSFATSAAAQPSASFVAAAPPQQAPATLALRLRNACAGTQLQALAYLRDASTGNWQSVGFLDLKPFDTSDAIGTTAQRTLYVYAQEKGRSCEGGGRCWRGDAGPFKIASGQSFKFQEVTIPDSAQGSFTYSFEC
jgi:hypothetical protein